LHYIKGDAGVVSRMQACSPEEIAVSAVVVYELECGNLRSKSPQRTRQVRTVLDAVQIIPFDHKAAHAAARIYTDLAAKGFLIGPMDLLIAGTAFSRNAVLATDNVREFARVKGLRLENWRQG